MFPQNQKNFFQQQQQRFYQPQDQDEYDYYEETNLKTGRLFLI